MRSFATRRSSLDNLVTAELARSKVSTSSSLKEYPAMAP